MRLTIVHLLNHCELANGNVHAAVDLACVQRKRGDEVYVLSSGGFFENMLSECGVVHIRISQSLRAPHKAFLAVIQILRLCRKIRPDVLHAHMMSGAMLGKIVALLMRRPIVNTIHNSFDSHSKIMKLGDAIVAVSNAEYRALFPKFGKRNLHFVINGPIGSPRYAEQVIGSEARRPNTIVALSGLHRRKGVSDIIRAFSSISKVHTEWSLTIIGEGPDEVNLKNLSDQLGVSERVHFLGKVEQPILHLRQHEIFVAASLVEPLGISVIEARIAGCAIIGSEVGGIPEILDYGECGLLVPPSAPEKLAAAISRLIECPDLRRNLQLRSQTGLDRFTAQAMHDGYKSIYSHLIKVDR